MLERCISGRWAGGGGGGGGDSSSWPAGGSQPALATSPARYDQLVLPLPAHPPCSQLLALGCREPPCARNSITSAGPGDGVFSTSDGREASRFHGRQRDSRLASVQSGLQAAQK